MPKQFLRRADPILLGLAADLCAKLAGCSPAPAALTQGKPVCLPSWAASLDKKASDALSAQLKALDPALYGSCEGACWLKQVGAGALACTGNHVMMCEHGGAVTG